MWRPEQVTEQMSPRRRAELAAAPLTYPEVGASRTDLPSGYVPLDRSRLIGRGAERFAAASGLVLSWRVQTGAGLRVRAESPTVRGGDLVDVGIGAGFVRLWAPCRVVDVLDEPRRRGFCYGTLPGHPECGEEAFLVTHDEHDLVWLRVRAFSRPAPGWPQLVAPAARLVQHRATERYLHSLD